MADVITTIFEIHWSASVVSHNLVGFALQVSSMWEQLLILVHWVVKWRMPLLRVSPFLQHYLPFLDENVTHNIIYTSYPVTAFRAVGEE